MICTSKKKKENIIQYNYTKIQKKIQKYKRRYKNKKEEMYILFIIYSLAGQIRSPQSSLSIVAISCGNSLKSKMSIFCLIRSFELDFGIGTVPISIYNE